MATTANLGATKLETGQANKETTINETADRVDAAVAGYLIRSVAGSSNVTLTTTEACNAVMEFTGALTGNISVALPSGASAGRARSFVVYNNTSGNFTLNVIYGAGNGVKVPQGYAMRLFHNGTHVYSAGDPFVPTTNVLTGPAWTAYTPTVSAGSGSFTTVSASGFYRLAGKTVHFRIKVTITTNGTAATHVSATLPFAAHATDDQTCAGMESVTTGKGLRCYIAAGGSTVQARFYDGTYPGASGSVLLIQGTYESA